MSGTNKEHKDRLFKFIFGNPSNKEWTLSLYNAVNGTNYSNAEDIELTTIEDAVYMSMKNDISFLVSFTMNFYEQQSTFNPNMPMRYLVYIGMVYAKYIEMNKDYHRYSTKLQKAPTPKCVCFYNGSVEKEDRIVLRLSDAFDGESDVEVKVLMININYGHNKELMEACKPLKDYAWFMCKIRSNQKETGDLEKSIEKALNEMDENSVLKKFLISNRAEVTRMCITEYDEERTLYELREESREEGRKEGIKEGEEKGKRQQSIFVALSMLKDGFGIEKSSLYSGLPIEEVKKLAEQRLQPV